MKQKLKGLAKKVATGVAIGALSISTLGCQGPFKARYSTPQDQAIGFFLGLKGGSRVSSSAGSVSNVPERMRYVPIHKDDSTSEMFNGVIKSDSAKLPLVFDIPFTEAGMRVNLTEDVRLRVYGELGLNINSLISTRAFQDDQGRAYKGNIGSTDRGIGAALTYWAPNIRQPIIPSINADISFPIDKDLDLILGTGFRMYDIEIENGWDRYNRLKQHKSYGIGRINETSVYLGLEMGKDKFASSNIKIGVNFNSHSGESHGIKVDTKPSVFGSFELRF